MRVHLGLRRVLRHLVLGRDGRVLRRDGLRRRLEGRRLGLIQALPDVQQLLADRADLALDSLDLLLDPDLELVDLHLERRLAVDHVGLQTHERELRAGLRSVLDVLGVGPAPGPRGPRLEDVPPGDLPLGRPGGEYVEAPCPSLRLVREVLPYPVVEPLGREVEDRHRADLLYRAADGRQGEVVGPLDGPRGRVYLERSPVGHAPA